MSYFTSRRRMNILVITLLIINVFSLSALWISYKNKLDRPPSPKAAEVFLKKELGLTDEQIAQIRSFRDAHFEEMQVLRRASHRSRQRMFAELKKPQPDSVLIETYAAQIGQAQTAIEKQTIEHFLDIKLSLEPSQQAKFTDVLERLLPPTGPRGPGGPGRPPGGPPPR